MNLLEPFSQQQYLNMETFRKSGLGVKTPVWFVQDGETLFVRTIADSGKVKRIHNNSKVNIAPCTMDGTPLGLWVPAQACEVTSIDIEHKVERLLGKKYGLQKTFFGLASAFRRQKSTILEIHLDAESSARLPEQLDYLIA
jgi:PPOX class probable F420-dependent enzyme